MSMRITVIDNRPVTKSPQSRPLREYRPNVNLKNFYIRSPKHVSRRCKSPFEKYEECVKQKMSSFSPNNDDLSFHKSNKSSTDSTISFKAVNKYEDFVVEKVDHLNNETAFYQRKYMLNLSPTCFERVEKVGKEKEKENYVLCARCKAKIQEEVVRKEEPKEQVKKLETIVSQVPLGTLLPEEKSIVFEQDELVDINPETAEQFIDLLIAEDEMLRRKIAEGQVDEKTMKRLEKLSELRKKYIEFKNSKVNFVEIPIVHEKTILEKINIPPPPKEFSSKQVTNKVNGLTFKKLNLGLSKVKSLSDPAFSLELSQHPLVRE